MSLGFISLLKDKLGILRFCPFAILLNRSLPEMLLFMSLSFGASLTIWKGQMGKCIRVKHQ